jgi:nuclear migration protein JNM1
LEGEVADPSNPALKAEGVDAGEMIRGLVGVRRRLEQVRMGREGRGRLVGVVLGDGGRDGSVEDAEQTQSTNDIGKESKRETVPEARSVVEMDKRVGELEKLVGSVSTTLDEVCDFCWTDRVWCSPQVSSPRQSPHLFFL